MALPGPAYIAWVDRYGRLDERKLINKLWRKTMSEKSKSGRDAFTFSLAGMNTISSFTIASAIADDRINRIRDQRLDQVRDNRDRQQQEWQPGNPQAVQDGCA